MNPKLHHCTKYLKPFKKWKVFLGAALSLFLYGCVTEYEGTIGGSSEVLVVSGIITDEFKKQEVQLSRSYSFENVGPRYETDAKVVVLSSNGSTYLFNEKPNGVYVSQQTFAAQPGITYHLEITTANGAAYASSPMGLPAPATITGLKAEVSNNAQGNSGISIKVGGSGPLTATKFRYDFEEHWKIVAPYWSPYDLVVLSEGQSTFNLAIIDRETEEQVCYGFARPQEVLLTSTTSLSSSVIENFEVRFIEKDNYILQHRYSILVKQYSISEETYRYYETLKSLSAAATTVFSEDQPGFLQGNIISLTNNSEQIAGFFEVSIVSEKRIFIDYQDLYPGTPNPGYLVDCILTAPTAEGVMGSRVLLNAIYDHVVRYFGVNTTQVAPGGPFLMVSPRCGDCTTLGSNIKPSFWTDAP